MSRESYAKEIGTRSYERIENLYAFQLNLAKEAESALCEVEFVIAIKFNKSVKEPKNLQEDIL